MSEQKKGALADLAERYQGMGIKEVAGPSSHPLIKEWIKDCEAKYPTDIPVDDSKYAWCGVFAGHCTTELGMEPPKYFQSAAKWMQWGAAVLASHVRRGDIMVKKRTGGNHVAIVARVVSTGVYVCGGNQSNAVTTVFYPFTDITGFRRHAAQNN